MQLIKDIFGHLLCSNCGVNSFSCSGNGDTTRILISLSVFYNYVRHGVDAVLLAGLIVRYQCE